MARDTGSSEPGTAAGRAASIRRTATRLNAAAIALLTNRCTTAEAAFRTLPTPQLWPLMGDPRTLHRQLYGGLFADQVVGAYRGSPAPLLQTARRIVVTRVMAPGLRRNDPCAPPSAVGPAMQQLCDDIAKFWHMPPTALLPHLCDMTHRMFWIHPFLDGNGHVWRLTMIALARRTDLSVTPQWQVANRPYGPGFGLGLQRYSVPSRMITFPLGDLRFSWQDRF